jgi:OmcA/MtrC family decaheme c-type cytochrome
VKNFHGAQYLLSSGEFVTAAKAFVTATITSATADPAGVVTVNFTVADAAKKPISKVATVSAAIAKLVPATELKPQSEWVPYIYRSRTNTTTNVAVIQGSRETSGTAATNGKLTNNGDGSYTYVFVNNLATAKNGTTPITYDRTLTHRVSIMMGGHSGPTAEAFFDFVPAGTPVVTTRNIVETATCKNCHGMDFKGHGGDRLTVEGCVVCHNPSSPSSYGPTADMTQMIHKIHAGGHLPSIAGPDGKVWDDPATTIDESADNVPYAFGSATWWKVGYPAELGNCQSCHTGKLAQVDNWKTVTTKAACASCHDTVNFETGVGHGGGIVKSDAACSTCHTDTKNDAQHDWTTKDARNTPEFTLDIALSKPANGTHFVAGESPIATVVIKKAGLPIDHTTVVEDDKAEGCAVKACPDADGKFMNSNFFVTGPRSNRNPVLTTVARATVVGTAGPFDLSAAGASLTLTLDGGQKVIKRDSEGGDIAWAGVVTVAVPATGAFVDKTAATAAEVIKWLNGNAGFNNRAIAFLQGTKVAIRSRNLGRTFSVQLAPGAVTTAVFAGDVAPKVVAAMTASNKLALPLVAANDDPKVTRTVESITYALDPVDDLLPGTYIVSLEIGDRGRVDANNYSTPSVAKLAFQVKTATVDKQIADGCESCHQGPDGRGLVLDPSRHNKILDHNAIDQCGACHDYQNTNFARNDGFGALPISKRVHAIHYGANLSYPQDTVGYVDPVAGRHWDITFPQNILNCESCHSAKDTSGTWATKPNRLACWGCHDSDAAQAHIKLNTYDPTPANPWSGDEQEACATCHASVTH